ncbi:MAG TPA: hypothetical protein VKG38_19540 [Solirubrobacteraceae bacterium]|nr:hypothetical protein [Solirubrobacteraceae bacterium]
MSALHRSRRSQRVGALLLLLFALSLWSLARAPADAVAGGVWKGTAEGILVGDSELHSDEVQSTSITDYQVELSFSFSLSGQSEVVGGGSGYYTDAHWHLSGVNGKEGSFGCSPPVAAAAFKVDVSGSASHGRVLLKLAIPDATETNENYNCGANYTGYATTTHAMSESLELVSAKGLPISGTEPTSLPRTKMVESGDSEDSHRYTHIWSFSVTPPAGGSGSGSGGGSGSEGGSGSSCSLSLSSVVAAPSPGQAGKPIAVSFHVSAPAKASLLVSPVGGTSNTVVTRNVPKGANELVWGGWLGTLPAPPGQYQLTVQAKGCGKTRSHAVSVSTT